MSEKMKNEVMEMETEVEEIEETKEGFLTKAKGFMKRNGKKIATGVVAVVGLGLAYALGQNSVKGSDDFTDEDSDSDTIDVEFTETEEE